MRREGEEEGTKSTQWELLQTERVGTKAELAWQISINDIVISYDTLTGERSVELYLVDRFTKFVNGIRPLLKV
jgi:hypothetical protein